MASNRPEDNEHALEIMRTVLKADTRPSDEIDLEALKREAGRRPVPHNEEPPTPQFAEKR
ncbi:MAG: hypothetical protein JO360_09580 [Acidobacteria bacterium]|nr:hypothetical protein [Acidobacteriota bacterium]